MLGQPQSTPQSAHAKHTGHVPAQPQHHQLIGNSLAQHFFALVAEAICTLHHTLCLKTFCKH